MKQLFSIAATCFWIGLGNMNTLPAQQNVGIGTSFPNQKLHIKTEQAADGILIDNHAVDGDPILQFGINGQPRYTIGVDDSDADKFKIGSTSLNSGTLLTFTVAKRLGLNTDNPEHMLHMTNGNFPIGTSSMAVFENLDTSGVALAGYNQGANNAYNAIEGVTGFQSGAENPAGVLGLALATQTSNLTPTIGVVGHSNLWQGIGVVGSRRLDNGPDNGFGGQFYYDIGYTGGLYNISDRRTKKEIQSISGAIGIVQQLRPVSYQFDTDQYPYLGLKEGKEYGFVAQEVQQVLPDITAEKTFMTQAGAPRKPGQINDGKPETFVVMDYSRLIPILTQAIREQQTQIDSLKAELEQLKEKVNVIDPE